MLPDIVRGPRNSILTQRLCQLRQLRKFRVSRRILQTFYAGEVESILTGSITAWFGNSSSQDTRALQRVLVQLNAQLSLHSPPCRTCTPGGVEPEPAMKDPHHPNNKLFQLLRSGKRLRSQAARTETKTVSFRRPSGL